MHTALPTLWQALHALVPHGPVLLPRNLPVPCLGHTNAPIMDQPSMLEAITRGPFTTRDLRLPPGFSPMVTGRVIA
jgi:hypothetical protein